MSFENNNFGLNEEAAARLAATAERRRRRRLGMPAQYVDPAVNYKTLQSMLATSKKGALTTVTENGRTLTLPENVESKIVEALGLRGPSFKKTQEKFKRNVEAHRELLRLQQEERNLRNREAIAAIEEELRQAREIREQQEAAYVAQQLAREREQAMREELKRIHRELQPDYIKASKKIALEEQRRKSREARGKNYNRYGTHNKKKNNNNAVKTSKHIKTLARKSQRKPRHHTNNNNNNQ